ncbi:hypothetical protein KUV50_15200 [Membranicola marinus]|uniref:Carbohydrate-binding domain-containing protein n=1 Tax=Membranihabitans marinus TaxID=1227546 RepID=A0A953HPQ2_9BACT|nr:carbohydrate-binding family 9-like protein [Membranihabitans marinus]MBY5959497.1 hypothetical protein [Membranihabitans marinus]
MKALTVPKIDHNGKTDLLQVSALLKEQTELHTIDQINWPQFPYTPGVSFRIGHTNEEIWIVFYVTEKHILARHTTTNSATHKDSCVEFFIDPKKNGHYYNFEFNAIGTTHLGYGPNIGKRNLIDAELIESMIRTRSTMGTTPVDIEDGSSSWELTAVIPARLLVHENITELSGLSAHANFFKCGDETSTPHYLSWNPVHTDRPSFHQPEFFGRLEFE